MKRSGASFFFFFQSTVLVSIGPTNSEGKNITPPKNEGYFDLLNGKVNCHSHGIRFENSKFIMFINKKYAFALHGLYGSRISKLLFPL